MAKKKKAAKRKVAKKRAKKQKIKCADTGFCWCNAIMAVVIIVLVWVSPAIWSKVIITVLAGLMIASLGGCFCKKKK